MSKDVRVNIWLNGSNVCWDTEPARLSRETPFIGIAMMAMWRSSFPPLTIRSRTTPMTSRRTFTISGQCR